VQASHSATSLVFLSRMQRNKEILREQQQRFRRLSVRPFLNTHTDASRLAWSTSKLDVSSWMVRLGKHA
jgi:hypothetical protein